MSGARWGVKFNQGDRALLLLDNGESVAEIPDYLSHSALAIAHKLNMYESLLDFVKEKRHESYCVCRMSAGVSKKLDLRRLCNACEMDKLIELASNVPHTQAVIL